MSQARAQYFMLWFYVRLRGIRSVIKMENSLGYRVGKLEINPGLVLAPMSGVTCRPFRKLLKEINGDALGMTVTEFISVEALTRKVRRSLEMMRKDPLEKVFSIQIFGYDIDRMELAAKMAQDAGADTVDINCGCPAPKVVRKGGGCELMRQPLHLGKILSRVRKAVSVPLTLKMRAGWDDSCRNAPDLAKIVESEGLDALAVHGRTRVQMYRGESDWDLIAQVSETVRIPVVGSGDVVDFESAKVRKEKGKVAGLMVGRGALENPFVFKEILQGGPLDWRNDQELILSVLRRYIELLRADFPEKLIPGRVKQLASGMCRGLKWRKALLTTQTQAELEDLLADPEKYLSLKRNNAGLLNSSEQTIMAESTNSSTC
jgi:nifR3 family TIM-barrel protein